MYYWFAITKRRGGPNSNCSKQGGGRIRQIVDFIAEVGRGAGYLGPCAAIGLQHLLDLPNTATTASFTLAHARRVFPAPFDGQHNPLLKSAQSRGCFFFFFRQSACCHLRSNGTLSHCCLGRQARRCNTALDTRDKSEQQQSPSSPPPPHHHRHHHHHHVGHSPPPQRVCPRLQPSAPSRPSCRWRCR